MQLNPNSSPRERLDGASRRANNPRLGWIVGVPCLAAVVTLACIAQQNQVAPPTNPDQTSGQPAANRAEDASGSTQAASNLPKLSKREARNAERKKQIADESATLLALAMALKAEVDKTDKDTLSLSVIRKASEIEKLAHSVRETIKQTGGAS